MNINFSHLRDRSTRGGWIDFAVFQADATVGTHSARSLLLAQLTAKARANGLKIDQSALVYKQNGRIQFFGDNGVVNYLSKVGVPRTSHTLTV